MGPSLPSLARYPNQEWDEGDSQRSTEVRGEAGDPRRLRDAGQTLFLQASIG